MCMCMYGTCKIVFIAKHLSSFFVVVNGKLPKGPFVYVFCKD